jgi:hypothetical protein
MWIPNGLSFLTSAGALRYIGNADQGTLASALNRFGLALQAASFSWTFGLCTADSDGDGFSNGVELGDPACIWLASASSPAWAAPKISDPSDATSTPAAWATTTSFALQQVHIVDSATFQNKTLFSATYSPQTYNISAALRSTSGFVILGMNDTTYAQLHRVSSESSTRLWLYLRNFPFSQAPLTINVTCLFKSDQSVSFVEDSESKLTLSDPTFVDWGFVVSPDQANCNAVEDPADGAACVPVGNSSMSIMVPRPLLVGENFTKWSVALGSRDAVLAAISGARTYAALRFKATVSRTAGQSTVDVWTTENVTEPRVTLSGTFGGDKDCMEAQPRRWENATVADLLKCSAYAFRAAAGPMIYPLSSMSNWRVRRILQRLQRFRSNVSGLVAGYWLSDKTSLDFVRFADEGGNGSAVAAGVITAAFGNSTGLAGLGADATQWRTSSGTSICSSDGNGTLACNFSSIYPPLNTRLSLASLPDAFQALSFGGQNLTGTLDLDQLDALTQLQSLDVSGNSFSGNFFGTRTSLPPTISSLNLAGNGRLTGLVSLGRFPSGLRFLDISGNSFSGGIVNFSSASPSIVVVLDRNATSTGSSSAERRFTQQAAASNALNSLPFVLYTCDANHGELTYQTYFANGDRSALRTLPAGTARPGNCNSCVADRIYNIALDPCIPSGSVVSSTFSIRERENRRCTVGCVGALAGGLTGVAGTMLVALITHFACFTEKKFPGR